jgi:hypothetical protein
MLRSAPPHITVSTRVNEKVREKEKGISFPSVLSCFGVFFLREDGSVLQQF